MSLQKLNFSCYLIILKWRNLRNVVKKYKDWKYKNKPQKINRIIEKYEVITEKGTNYLKIKYIIEMIINNI